MTNGLTKAARVFSKRPLQGVGFPILTALLFACSARAESERQFEPPLALDGYCPVVLAEENRWETGDWRYAAVYESQRYYFAGAGERQKFLGNPSRYRVIASGVDVVLAMDQGRVVRGKREHGLWFGHDVYLFGNEESLEQFTKSPQRYTVFAHRIQNPDPHGHEDNPFGNSRRNANQR